MADQSNNSLLDIANNGAALNQAISELSTNVAKLSSIKLPVANGGTGQNSLTANNVLLGNGTSGVQFVAPGTNGNVLTSDGTTWKSTSLPTPAANVSSITFGTTGLTPNTATTGAVSVAGTLIVTNGGTGLSSLTAYGLLCGGTTTTGNVQSLTTGTLGQVLTSNGSSALPSWQAKVTSGTAKAYNYNGSSSNTSIPFTGIPSWAKRIIIMFNGIKTNGTSLVTLRVGSGSIQSTGYSGGYAIAVNAGTSITAQSSTYFYVSGNNSSNDIRYGNMILTNINSNTWIQSGVVGTIFSGGTNGTMLFGKVDVTGVLDQISITTVNGTDQFNAGSINIMYE